MGKLTVHSLRVVMVALLAGSLIVQAFIVPLLAKDLEGLDPAYSFLRVPLPAIVFLGVVAGQVIVVCVWRLVAMVRRGTVFSHASFRYVDVIIGAIGAGALLVFALGFLLAPGEAVAPGVVLLVGGVGLAIVGVALVVVVLRALLAQAVRMEAELEEVV
ncbi:DUF2975 domain-containing protein [Nonomuraea soli]|uniref:DUF2975 domain-containing protein n=1 Tax=Nonomuraea soli TaxID=1032476 RepID=A0A7W0CJ36_9ACTN|nr:DUF2975 domain-containing protein [Nonomuraea soli]MBA2891860.1 hypothetical protein [Nonomuraea soli]